MVLEHLQTPEGPIWTLDGAVLSVRDLSEILSIPAADLAAELTAKKGQPAAGTPLPAVEANQEVWASGVTYLRSRVEREAESTAADVYGRVYEADRPELFFKAIGERVVGPGAPIRIRRDSNWDVPEPELTLVINRFGDIVGYTAGNDVSSREIEGENPLYLPQAKSYDGSCALASKIVLASPDAFRDTSIRLTITRDGSTVFEGETSTTQMKRKFEELAGYLTRELTFPRGVLLMTGTGIVPAAPFTLQEGDTVQITVGSVTLENPVSR